MSELKAFLGLINYYGKFLPNLSTVLEPLYRLLQKRTLWTWQKEQQVAFNKAKALLKSSRVLVHYDDSKKLVCSVTHPQWDLEWYYLTLRRTGLSNQLVMPLGL